jgi:hypothetical protein
MDATMIMLFMLFIVFSLLPLGAGPSSEADKPKEGIMKGLKCYCWIVITLMAHVLPWAVYRKQCVSIDK